MALSKITDMVSDQPNLVAKVVTFDKVYERRKGTTDFKASVSYMINNSLCRFLSPGGMVVCYV